MTVVQPRDGKIYANGAVKVRVDHLFLGKTTNHGFDVEIPDDPAPPIAGTGPSNSRFSDEFQHPGRPPRDGRHAHDRGHQAAPEADRPAQPPLQLREAQDPRSEHLRRIRGAAGLPRHGEPHRPGAFVLAEQPGPRQRPARDVLELGDRRRPAGQRFPRVPGVHGQGDVRRVGDLARDGLRHRQQRHGAGPAGPGTLHRPGQSSRDADRDFRTWQDKLNGAVAQYQQFKAGFGSLEKLAGIYDTIASLMKSGASCRRPRRNWRSRSPCEKDAQKLAELVKQLLKVKDDLEKLQDQVTVAIDQRDKILTTIPSALKINAPLNLVKTAAAFLEELGKGGRGKLINARTELNGLAGSLADFQGTLWGDHRGEPPEERGPGRDSQARIPAQRPRSARRPARQGRGDRRQHHQKPEAGFRTRPTDPDPRRPHR